MSTPNAWCPHDRPIETYCINCPDGVASSTSLVDVSFAQRTETCEFCEQEAREGYYTDDLEFICSPCARRLAQEAQDIRDDNERIRRQHENNVLREVGGLHL